MYRSSWRQSLLIASCAICAAAAFCAYQRNAAATIGPEAASLSDAKKIGRPSAANAPFTGSIGGTWITAGRGYKGIWHNGSKAVMRIMRVTPSEVDIRRKDTLGKTKGLVAEYIGHPVAAGSIAGTVIWRYRGYVTTGVWQAAWHNVGILNENETPAGM